MRVLVKYRSMSTSVGRVRNGDIIDIPKAEYKKICITKPMALEALPELPLEEPKKVQKPVQKKAPAKRKRARKADGTLKGDDPSTPDVNEAWEDGKHLN